MEKLAYFVAEPPEYEAHGDYIIGRRNGMEFVFTVMVAQQITLRLQEALAKCAYANLDTGNVIHICPRPKH